MNLVQKLLLMPYGIWIVLFLTTISFVGLLFLIVNIIYFAQYKRLQSVALQVGGQAIYNLLHGPHMALRHGGTEFRLYFRNGGQHALPSMIIQCPITFTFKLHVIDRSATELPVYVRLARGNIIEPNDSEIKHKILVKTNNSSRATALMERNSRWDIVKSLIEKGYQKLAIEKNCVVLQKWGFSEDDLNKQMLTETIDSLNRFSAETS